MSDQTAAPQAPTTLEPQTTEVPVNQNPIHTPNPIGSQAPDKPVGDHLQGSRHRPESRQETIQKAFNKVREQQAARPKPEAKVPEKSRPPVETDTGSKPNPYREQGRFARAPGPEPSAAQIEQAQNAQNTQSEQTPPKPKPLPDNAPYREPPQRMADHAKADWAGTPESVRGEVGRMHREFGEAYNAYRTDHEAMNEIRPFQELATKHGTTLHKALSNYLSIENKLRSDLVGGLDQIINNLELQTPDGKRLGLYDVAYHVVNQTPEQHQMVQSRNYQNAMSLQLGQISQRLDAMDQTHQRMMYEQRVLQARANIDNLAADGRHPRLDELADLIKNELELGFDFETAYRRADLLRPAPRAAQTRETAQAAQTRDPSAQTRTAARSISGAPDGDASDARNGVSKKRNGKAPSRMETIQNAIRRVNGSY